jgi:hypothetical protein
MMNSKRRWKSLSLKVEHLRLELEEREDVIKDFEKEFLSALSGIETEDVEEKTDAHVPAHVVDRSKNDDLPEEIEQPEREDRPEDVKKLWRSVALASHPDRTNNDPEKTDMYKRAMDAFNSGSYDELLRIAGLLGVEPPESLRDNVEMLESLSDELETKLKEKEKSVLWMWGTTSDEKKQGIIDIYLKSKGKRRKKTL